MAVHLNGDPSEIAPLVKDGGLLISPILYSPDMFPDAERVTPAPIAAFPTAQALQTLVGLVDSGALRVIVDREHPFDEVGQAFEEFGHETLGNIVIRIS